MRFDAKRGLSLLMLALLVGGCAAHYVTPGGPARLDDNAWSSNDTVDRKRLAAEQEACKLLLVEAAETWDGIIAEHAE